MGHYYSEMSCDKCGKLSCICKCEKCHKHPCVCPCRYCGKERYGDHRCIEFDMAVSKAYKEMKAKENPKKTVKKPKSKKKLPRFVGDEPKILKEVLRDLKSIDDLETHEEICDVLSDNIKILIKGVKELLEYHK